VRGGPAAFHEVMSGYDTSGCILQRLSVDLDNGPILDRAVVRTIKTSVRRHLEQVLWKSTAMMPRKLEELWRKGHLDTEDESLNLYHQPLFKVPKNREMRGRCWR
jgi:folate-dependent phosphoribosylglycinamide formyltransferase PurN